jgi:REP element-mobilizing transposase RayT
MSVRRNIYKTEGIYFITFTCTRWLKLFEITQSYDLVYKWFRYLIDEGHYIVGYIIMPDHIHALIAFRNKEKSINLIVGNGKRFIAYGLVDRLRKNQSHEILRNMRDWVNPSEKNRNKEHEVFEPSFDWKESNSERLIEQKLDYIHQNPCKGENPLVNNPQDYEHSSAQFYITNEKVNIKLTTWLELQDIDLTIDNVSPQCLRDRI